MRVCMFSRERENWWKGAGDDIKIVKRSENETQIGFSSNPRAFFMYSVYTYHLNNNFSLFIIVSIKWRMIPPSSPPTVKNCYDDMLAASFIILCASRFNYFSSLSYVHEWNEIYVRYTGSIMNVSEINCITSLVLIPQLWFVINNIKSDATTTKAADVSTKFMSISIKYR